MIRIFHLQRERGKHLLVALSHVANKMLHVVFSVLKNNRPYTACTGGQQHLTQAKNLPMIGVDFYRLPIHPDCWAGTRD